MMVSAKKSVMKRIWIIMLAVLVAHSAVSMVATKLICDSIFARYDPDAEPLPLALEDLVEQREELSFPCGELQLAGYLYRCQASQPRDTLVVLAPGFHAGADDYLWQIGALLEKGWSVFSFDPSGSCGSEGKSYIGFPQEVADLEAALSFLEQQGRFGYTSLALLGHSRGGYAAGCVLGQGYEIDAVITVSGVNSAMEAIMGYSTSYVGPLAYGNYGFLWLYQTMQFGADRVNRKAHCQINGSDVPVLVVHGSEDVDFPAEKYSIIAHREQITAPRVEYLICDEPGQNGHTDLLFAPDGTANPRLMTAISDFLEKSIG